MSQAPLTGRERAAYVIAGAMVGAGVVLVFAGLVKAVRVVLGWP